MKKILTTLMFCLLITACSSDESEIKSVVRASLKDPESARFGRLSNTITAIDFKFVCIYVNAKNSMGGYTGEKLFVLKKGLSKASRWKVYDKDKYKWICGTKGVW